MVTIYYTVRSFLSHYEKLKQKMVYLNAKLCITKKLFFKCLGFVYSDITSSCITCVILRNLSGNKRYHAIKALTSAEP